MNNASDAMALPKPLPENARGIETLQLRRARRRRRGDPNRVKGILKKTSSYGGKLCRQDSDSSSGSSSVNSRGLPKKRVSFPGLTSCRWDSQGAMSLTAPSPNRWSSEEPRQTNQVWKARKADSSATTATSLNDLYLRARNSRVSPIVEHKRKVAIQQAFQNLTLTSSP